MKQWDAIGFDLDGTLWDYTQTVEKSWSKVCREDPRVKKIQEAKNIQGIMGLTLEEIAKRFFPYLSLKEGLEILNRCAQDEVGPVSYTHLNRKEDPKPVTAICSASSIFWLPMALDM